MQLVHGHSNASPKRRHDFSEILHSGQSGAILQLLHTDSNCFVRKISRKNPAKLFDQYEWLHRNQKLEFVPRVFNPLAKSNSFSYDMPYYQDFIPLYKRALCEDFRYSSFFIQLFSALFQNFYQGNIQQNTSSLYSYITEKFLKKIHHCQILYPQANPLLISEEISINGKICKNYLSLVKDLQKSKLEEICSKFSCQTVHGDLTAENILIRKQENSFILIDPNPENQVFTPALDLAKLYQSFHSQYEMLKLANLTAASPHSISFQFPEKNRFKEIYQFLDIVLREKYFLNHRELIFHEAMHFARLLPYQIVYNRKIFPVFYARMLELWNHALYGERSCAFC